MQVFTPQNKKKTLVLSTLILAAIVVGVLELTNTTHIFHETAIPDNKTASEFTKGEQSTPTDEPSDATEGNTINQTKDDTTTPETASLLQPSGNFVSNHR